MINSRQEYALAVLRIAMGWMFLWSFLDSMFGFGLPNASESAVINGNSATFGFLSFGTQGSPFAGMFQAIAGNPVVDLLYLVGMLGVGLALILGIGVRIASIAGMLQMFLIYLASLFPANNPFLDAHLIYVIVLSYYLLGPVSDKLSIRQQWKSMSFVKQFPILE